jgi:hypothetical protein
MNKASVLGLLAAAALASGCAPDALSNQVIRREKRTLQ